MFVSFIGSSDTKALLYFFFLSFNLHTIKEGAVLTTFLRDTPVL